MLPTINEAGNIGPLIESLRAELTDAAPEFLVIDGHSTDGTPTEAENCWRTGNC